MLNISEVLFKTKQSQSLHFIFCGRLQQRQQGHPYPRRHVDPRQELAATHSHHRDHVSMACTLLTNIL